MADVLPALKFNAEHSGDALARVFFRQAADEIEQLRAVVSTQTRELHRRKRRANG